MFLLVRGNLRAGEASEAAVSIADLIELGQLDRAGEFLATLEKAGSPLLAYPPMIDASQRYQTARDKDTERSLQFDRAMRLAEQAPLQEVDPRSLQTARSLRVGRPRSRRSPG